MDNFAWLALSVLVVCFLGVGFAYFGYPAAIYICSKLFGTKAKLSATHTADLPFVSLLISAFNEQDEIEKRLYNAMALDYPPEKFEVVIASDGSTDRTNELVRRVSALFKGRIRLLDFPNNRGKATVLNEAVPLLNGEIIVLSDANTTMREDAILKLVSWFDQPDIGVVCGRLVMTDVKTGNNVDSLYWKYETFLKKCESRLGALLGSNGAIYAIRKNLFPGVPHGTIIDDFYIPLEAKRRSGCRIVYDTRAVACEETAPSIRAEFHRRSRLGAGGFQSIGMLWPLLSPAHGWVAFAFFSHKVLRWICPFLLLTMVVANLFVLDLLIGQIAMALQVISYTLAITGNWLPKKPKIFRILRLPTMFVMMNSALFVGFFKWLSGGQSGAWKRTARSGEMPALILSEQQVTA